MMVKDTNSLLVGDTVAGAWSVSESLDARACDSVTTCGTGFSSDEEPLSQLPPPASVSDVVDATRSRVPRDHMHPIILI